MKREIRIGSRDSELAIIQSKLVINAIARAHPELSLRLVAMKSQGDLRPDLPLGGEGKGLFTAALEAALVRGEIDLCVHSLKDMGVEQNPDLPIVAMMKREDPRDMLILPRSNPLGGLEYRSESSLPSPPGGLSRALFQLSGVLPVGTSSPRRWLQLGALAPELRFAPVRGNVPTRLSKLDVGQYGALVLAAAGLIRLGLGGREGYVFPVEEMVPAAGQGVLAIQGRRGENYHFLEQIRDLQTEEEALVERTFVRIAGGGCDVPSAAYARIEGNEIFLIGFYAEKDAPSFQRALVRGKREQGRRLAEILARKFAGEQSR